MSASIMVVGFSTKMNGSEKFLKSEVLAAQMRCFWKLSRALVEAQ